MIMHGTGRPDSGMAARGRGGGTRNGRGRAGQGRRRGNPGKGKLPSGGNFMKPVASATMRRERDRAPEGSRKRAVWEGCIRRRAGMPARDIAAEVGMSYSTMYRDLVAMHGERGEEIARPDGRDVGRGSYHVAAAGNTIIISRTGGIDKGRRGRPHKYSDAYFIESAILRRLAGIKYRQMAGNARDGAGGRFDTPSFSTFHKRIKGLEIEEDGAGGRLWIGRGDARYEVGMVVMGGTELRATPLSEHMPPKDGSRKGDGRRIAVAFDAASRKALLVEMRGASEGKETTVLARLFEGALGSVERNPGMTLTEGAIAAYGGAMDAAGSYEIVEKAGAEMLAPAGIDPSVDPAFGGPAKEARKMEAAVAPRKRAGADTAAPPSGGRRPAKGERPCEKRRPASGGAAPTRPRQRRRRFSRA